MPRHIIYMTMATNLDPAVELISNNAQPTARNAPMTAVLNIKGLGTIKLTQTVKKLFNSIVNVFFCILQLQVFFNCDISI